MSEEGALLHSVPFASVCLIILWDYEQLPLSGSYTRPSSQHPLRISYNLSIFVTLLLEGTHQGPGNRRTTGFRKLCKFRVFRFSRITQYFYLCLIWPRLHGVLSSLLCHLLAVHPRHHS